MFADAYVEATDSYSNFFLSIDLEQKRVETVLVNDQLNYPWVWLGNEQGILAMNAQNELVLISLTGEHTVIDSHVRYVYAWYPLK